jgi:plasmid stabilization system protein ParE
MSWSIVWRPEAEADLLTTIDWYEWQRSGLGEEFAEAIEKTIALVETRPELYAIVFLGVRRARVRRFPYVIYYRVFSRKVEVLAVLHASRDAKVWQNRT